MGRVEDQLDNRKVMKETEVTEHRRELVKP